MSIYKQFIDSAAATAPVKPRASSKSSGQLDQQLEAELGQRSATMATMMMRQKSCAGGRAPVVRMSPMFGPVTSALSSTPVSGSEVARNNYKRMVPANEFRSQQQIELSGSHQLNSQYGRLQQQQQQQSSSPQSSKYHRACETQQPQFQVTSAPKQLSQLHRAHQTMMNQPHQAQASRQMSASCYSLLNQVATRAPPASNLKPAQSVSLESVFKTDDPVLLEWMQAMRFDTELECLTALQARTLAIDENLAGALSVRNSQVAIQEMRLDSDYILDLTDILIDSLPVNFNTIDKFAVEFSNLWRLLMRQTEAQTRANSNTYTNFQKNLTIINCTPRKSLASARTLRPLDELSNEIRKRCLELANTINKHQENYQSNEPIDNNHFAAILRHLKELYGKFVEMSIRAECANIVRALEFDFSSGSRSTGTQPLLTSKLQNAPNSAASLKPVRVYQSSSTQLPLKWALIALWQLTKEDGFICRLLTEMWQTGAACNNEPNVSAIKPKSGVAKRLDYSTKYEEAAGGGSARGQATEQRVMQPPPPPSSQACEKPSEICQRFCENQQMLLRKQQHQQHQQQQSQRENCPERSGALSSALKSKQPSKQLSAIELLIDIIISQPNRHERVDVMNFIQNTRLIDVEQLDQSVSAAFYTSNQYKVAALRILNHLCLNEQAVKTILKCFSTPPPKQGHPLPQNKIIRSIFECYQTAQEHIYQNETMLHANRTPSMRRARKRARQVLDVEYDEHSDYGSRPTSSVPTSGSLADAEPDFRETCAQDADADADDDDAEGDDAVVKEAIRLLIQLTTPFHRSNQGHDYYTLIGRFSVESLVKYLTNIIKSTANREMILLSLSALANISFITTEPMKASNTSQVILETLRASKARSKDLELRDQTVTILANMADKNSFDIQAGGSNEGALTFLLSCLEVCPSRMSNYKLRAESLNGHAPNLDNHYAHLETLDYQRGTSAKVSSRQFNIDNRPRDRKPIQVGDEFFDDLDCVCDNQRQTNMPMMCLSRLRPSELAAMERIHQKTAVAFARLSNDSAISQLVLKYGGVKQMIDLCKLSNRRNHSDTVLIACLAALRKMSKVIGSDVFRHYNALDLIELELNQALEIYGRLYATEV